MRCLIQQFVCALIFLFAANAQTLAASPVIIPSLTPWLGTNGKPTAAAWRHAAHFAVDNEIQPRHNVAALVKT